MDHGKEFLNPDKQWDADTISAIAEVVAQYIPRPGEHAEAPTELPCGQAATPNITVIVTVSGGVADVLLKPKGTAVAIYDYDVEGCDENDPAISRDPDSHACCISQWDAPEEVAGCQHWATVQKAREGSYSRTWKCPGCGRTIEHSYEPT